MLVGQDQCSNSWENGNYGDVGKRETTIPHSWIGVLFVKHNGGSLMVLACFALLGWEEIAVRKNNHRVWNYLQNTTKFICFGKEGWEKTNAVVLD